jgi:hypothetical protein
VKRRALGLIRWVHFVVSGGLWMFCNANVLFLWNVTENPMETLVLGYTMRFNIGQMDMQCNGLNY